VSLSYRPTKLFHFEWIGNNTTTYKLKEKADSSASFTVVKDDIAGTASSYDHIVTLHKRVNAEYIIQACNGDVCVDSNVVSVSGNLSGSVGYFKASNTDANDEFGKAVALSGDGKTLAVGAYHEDGGIGGINGANEADNSQHQSGAAYVYVLNGTVWEKQAYIKAPTPAVDDEFGTAIALAEDGNTLVVGARYTGNDRGTAFVFSRSGTTWTQSTVLNPSEGMINNFDGALFGTAVGISDDGNTIAVGAPGRNSNKGSVYVYTRSINNTWTQHLQPIVATNGEAADEFGFSVALNGDGTILAAGAVGEASANTTPTNNSAADAGAVYVFTFAANAWTETKYLKAAFASAGDQFGYRVALSDDGSTLAVGAPFEDGSASNIDPTVDDDSQDSGAAYVFEKTDTTWSAAAYIKSFKNTPGDLFGFSVALTRGGKNLLIGARDESGNSIGVNQSAVAPDRAKSGAAYLVTSTNDIWKHKNYLKASNAEAGDAFGRSVAISSDGNTIAVGATSEASKTTLVNGDQSDNSKSKSGAVYLY
jgi:hypothetical protein